MRQDEENLRESSIGIRPSNPTTEKSSINESKLNQKNGMIVERNDRFIIFKMMVTITFSP